MGGFVVSYGCAVQAAALSYVKELQKLSGEGGALKSVLDVTGPSSWETKKGGKKGKGGKKKAAKEESEEKERNEWLREGGDGCRVGVSGQRVRVSVGKEKVVFERGSVLPSERVMEME